MCALDDGKHRRKGRRDICIVWPCAQVPELPANMHGVELQGMVLAASTADDFLRRVRLAAVNVPCCVIMPRQRPGTAGRPQPLPLTCCCLLRHCSWAPSYRRSLLPLVISNRTFDVGAAISTQLLTHLAELLGMRF